MDIDYNSLSSEEKKAFLRNRMVFSTAGRDAPPEALPAATFDQLESVKSLLVRLAPLAGNKQVVDTERPEPFGVRVDQEFAIYRSFDAVTKTFRWTGADLPPDKRIKPFRRSFPDLNHVLTFAMSRMVADIPFEERDRAYSELMEFGKEFGGDADCTRVVANVIEQLATYEQQEEQISFLEKELTTGPSPQTPESPDPF